MIDTILFDLDGTLLPMEQDAFIKAYFGCLIRKMAPHGYEKDQLIQAVWTGTKAMIRNDGDCSNRDVFWDVFAGILGESVREFESELDQFYTQEFDAVKCVMTYPANRKEFLAGLRQKGFRLVLATNPIFPAEAVTTRLNWIGLEPSDFELVTHYTNSRYCKPNLAYYRSILNQLSLQPEQCLMIGNSVEEDLCASKLGIESFLLTENIENPNQLDYSAYAHGDFSALEQWLTHFSSPIQA